MKCPLCQVEDEKLNDKTLPEHYGLETGAKSAIVQPCAGVALFALVISRLDDAAKIHKVKDKQRPTLIARALVTQMQATVIDLLEHTCKSVPKLSTDTVLSLLGTILKTGDLGFKEELKEAARRATKGYSVVIGPQAPMMVKALLNEELQEKIRATPHGEEALTDINSQIVQLLTADAVRRGDMLGGDIVDFDKGKCIQIKAVTSTSIDKFYERLREAANQLKGDVAQKKREVPLAGFRRVADIRLSDTNPAFHWKTDQFIAGIGFALSPKGSKKDPTELRGFVDVVRISAAFGTKNFRVSTDQISVKL